jgi:antibiotic biosynthesis monooxygenase (ABM) superfamily enzyme
MKHSSSFKIYSIIIIVGLYFTGLIINTCYRPWVYENGNNDFGLADIGGNFIFVPIISFASWIFSFSPTKNKQKQKDLLIFCSIYILLEIASYFIPFIGTFDFKDFVGLIFGYFISVFLLWIYNTLSLE